MASMKVAFGFFLIAAGIAIGLFGHKRIPVRGGAVMRAVSPGGVRGRIGAWFQSIALGLVLIGFGIVLVLE
jgi:hypothetical protein